MSFLLTRTVRKLSSKKEKITPYHIYTGYRSTELAPPTYRKMSLYTVMKLQSNCNLRMLSHRYHPACQNRGYRTFD